MPLTPEDVSNKRFTPVRLREGYDMGEVDQFLDEVEAELTRLNRENQELRGGLGTSQDGEAGRPGASSEPVPEPTTQPAPRQQPTEQAAAEPVPAAPVETIKVSTASEASTAAVRLLEIATRNADELVGEAEGEAERIVGEARTSSERLETASKERADKLESEARARSKVLNSETEERRVQLLGDLDTEKQRLHGEVENLRSFEREYRTRLKTYFEQQLSALDGSGDPDLPSDEEHAALGEDSGSS